MLDQELLERAESLHISAMQIAERAYMEKRSGDQGDWLSLLKKSLLLEKQAADLLPVDPVYEPSRSILYRSAASLAYETKDYALSNRLIAFGLSGFPPQQVSKELGDLYDEVNFMRHVENQGRILTSKGFSVTLAGNNTYHGGAELSHLVTRLQKAEKMFYRTLYRLAGLNYDQATQHNETSNLKDQYELYADVQFASSYGVYVKVVYPDKQLSLLGDEGEPPIDPAEVIAEVRECLDLWNSASPDSLLEKIGDEQYYSSFVALAKNFAPDGDEITTVGFNVLVQGEQKPVIIRRNRNDWIRAVKEQATNNIDDHDDESPEMLTTVGELRRASTPKSGKPSIALMEEKTGRSMTLLVDPVYMKEAVNGNYEGLVQIEYYAGKKNSKGKNILHLVDIAPVLSGSNSE